MAPTGTRIGSAGGRELALAKAAFASADGTMQVGLPVCAVVTSPESGDRTAHPIDQIR